MPRRIGELTETGIIAEMRAEIRRLWRAVGSNQGPVGEYNEYTLASSSDAAHTLTYIPSLSLIPIALLNGLGGRYGADYTVDFTTGIVTWSATKVAGDVLEVFYQTTGDLVALSGPVDLGSFTITDTFGGHAANTDLSGLTTSDGKATWTLQNGNIRTATTTGGAYSATTASTYTIDSAAVSSTPNGLTQVDVTPAVTQFTGIVGRYVDLNNFFTFQNRSNSANEGKLVRRVAGSSVDVVTGLPVGTTKKTMGLEFVGDTVNLYVSGSLIWTGTDSALDTATKFGLWSNTNLVPQEWDNFQFTGNS